jgi:hypothetical protein
MLEQTDPENINMLSTVVNATDSMKFSRAVSHVSCVFKTDV